MLKSPFKKATFIPEYKNIPYDVTPILVGSKLFHFIHIDNKSLFLRISKSSIGYKNQLFSLFIFSSICLLSFLLSSVVPLAFSVSYLTWDFLFRKTRKIRRIRTKTAITEPIITGNKKPIVPPVCFSCNWKKKKTKYKKTNRYKCQKLTGESDEIQLVHKSNQ